MVEIILLYASEYNSFGSAFKDALAKYKAHGGNAIIRVVWWRFPLGYVDVKRSGV